MRPGEHSPGGDYTGNDRSHTPLFSLFNGEKLASL